MENWTELLALWPLVLIVLLAVVLIRAGRGTKPHGDDPRDSTGGYDP
ncbi:hypothetical protein [Flavimaricola marinus]|uniref:Uncharacterized protein n=1 Tax=Flavimaricola marinus TaxID=1819565 RepID=A0A238LI80_9RHOB|nr:hypothetical protein [Flavimaricola marinus]SMY09105.1 hypothetical protein LOM8899_03267 [Flavimaricola marinus]